MSVQDNGFKLSYWSQETLVLMQFSKVLTLTQQNASNTCERVTVKIRTLSENKSLLCQKPRDVEQLWHGCDTSNSLVSPKIENFQPKIPVWSDLKQDVKIFTPFTLRHFDHGFGTRKNRIIGKVVVSVELKLPRLSNFAKLNFDKRNFLTVLSRLDRVLKCRN